MKKICLVADVPNWAFDIIAHALKEKFVNKYDIRIVYYNARKESDVFFEFIEKNDDCDLIHFFGEKYYCSSKLIYLRKK